MSIKVYNQLILEGCKKDIETLINNCYGVSPMEECKKINKPYLTFNSYLALDSDDREKAYATWGTAVDSLNDYSISFETVMKNLSNKKPDDITTQNISFETYNGFVFPWVKEMAKSNPNVKVKYFVVDKAFPYFGACEFDDESNNIEYNSEKYSTHCELKHKFLGYSLEESLKDEVDYIEFKMNLYSDENKEYKLTLDEKKELIEREFSFLPNEDLVKLIEESI